MKHRFKNAICGTLVFLGLCCVVQAANDEKAVLFKGKSPSTIYSRVMQAKWDHDAHTVYACTSKRVNTSVEEIQRSLMLDRSTFPYHHFLIGKEDKERFVTLLYRGERYDRDTKQMIISRGKILMVQEDGTWRIRHEDWEDVDTEPLVGDPPY